MDTSLKPSPQVLCDANTDPDTSLMASINHSNYKRKHQDDGTNNEHYTRQESKGVNEIKKFNKVLADSFKLAVAALQHRWAQWVSSTGTVEGLGTLEQFVPLNSSYPPKSGTTGSSKFSFSNGN